MNCGQTTTPCHICKMQPQCSRCPGRGSLYNIVGRKLNKHDAPFAGCVGMCCGIFVCEESCWTKLRTVYLFLIQTALLPLVICFLRFSLSFGCTQSRANRNLQWFSVTKYWKTLLIPNAAQQFLFLDQSEKIKVFRTQLDCSIAIELQQELKIARTWEGKRMRRVREA